MTPKPADADPDADRVYCAEATVEGLIGPEFSSWNSLVEWLNAVIIDDRVLERFSNVPPDIQIGRRSRSASASLASVARSAILIRDGSRTSLTALHELAHLIAPGVPPHGPRFRETVCELARITCGIEASTELQAAYRAQGL